MAAERNAFTYAEARKLAASDPNGYEIDLIPFRCRSSHQPKCARTAQRCFNRETPMIAKELLPIDDGATARFELVENPVCEAGKLPRYVIRIDDRDTTGETPTDKGRLIPACGRDDSWVAVGSKV